MVSRRSWILGVMVAASLTVLFLLELFFGSAELGSGDVWAAISGHPSEDWHRTVILESRLPRAFTAMLSGAGLAVGGLLLQTLFRNPLAGPSVLGITSGSSLGVAMLLLGGGGAIAGGSNALAGSMAISAAAVAGAMTVLAVVVLVAVKLRDQVSLLIFGLMVGYLTAGLVSVLEFGASKDALRAMVFWGFGTFASATWTQLSILTLIVLPSLFLSFLLIKSLNVMLLGQEEAEALGVRYQRMRLWIILLTGLLAGSITACCGPVAFLGLAVPHLCRGLWRSSDQLVLVPAVILTGASMALLCDLISRMPWSEQSLPLNAVTSLIGAPVVIHIIFRTRKMKGFF